MTIWYYHYSQWQWHPKWNLRSVHYSDNVCMPL